MHEEIKYILLIRHSESIKNLNNTYSSANNDELLTKQGLIQSNSICDNLIKFIDDKKLLINAIYCAKSERAFSTIKSLSEYLKLNLHNYEDLTSYKMGEYAGCTESTIKEIDIDFFYKQMLYRNGLFNAYDIKYGSKAEDPIQFEKRVCDTIYNIIQDNDSETVKIIVLHRSAITAFLINLARKFYNYPINFYGYIKLELGNISLIKYQNNYNYKILGVNLCPENIHNLK